MKKSYLLPFIGLGVIFFTSSNAYGAELKPITQEIQDRTSTVFGTLNDSDSLIQLPDGGYLHGKAYEVSSDNPEQVLAVYDSDTDLKKTTVKEVKHSIKLSEQNNQLDKNVIAPRGTTPPQQTSYMVLQTGGQYWSSKFSGSGWRFGGRGFMPAAGTGIYLGWQTFVDDGNIGGPNEAHSTWAGSYRGKPLYVSEGYTYKAPGETTPGFPWLAIYYTLNPVSGAYYYVANI